MQQKSLELLEDIKNNLSKVVKFLNELETRHSPDFQDMLSMFGEYDQTSLWDISRTYEIIEDIYLRLM